MTVSRRDLRLDFFRGFALWLIFIDHVPSNWVARLTVRNFGFSDATEIFVFVSGFTAAIVYGRHLAERGVVFMAAQVLRRCWQLYAAHLIVLLLFIGQIVWISGRFDNAAFLDEMNIAQFFDEPQQSLIEALKLHYRPANLDVLPLYMALLIGLPAILWLMKRSVAATFVASAALYGLVQWRGTAFPVYSDGESWLFNPLAWQFLFVIGAICGWTRNEAMRWAAWRGWLAAIAFAWLAASLVVVASWSWPSLHDRIEPAVAWLYPIDKTNLHPARLVHFLAMAYLVSHLIPAQTRLLDTRIARPIIRCGQHALHVFCLGIILSFLAHFVLVELGRGWLMQVLVVVGGLVLLSVYAGVLQWYRDSGSRAAVRSVG